MSLEAIDSVQVADSSVHAEVISSVLIEIPVMPFDASKYRTNQLHLRLTQRQADAMRVIFDGLHEAKRKLDSGKHVDSPADAVKWILERIADEISPVA